MDLSTVFAKFPNFRVFRPGDEEAVHRMLAETPMRVGGMELAYERRPSFARALDYQAPNHFTTVADFDGEIRGFGSYTWGRRLAGGKPTTSVYIGDFRVKTDRRVAAGWRACYPKMLKLFASDAEFGPAEWVVSGILADNLAAKRSFVDHRKSNGFYYHPLARLTMVNVFFRPRKFRKPGVRVVSGAELGEERLREFLARANAALFLGYDFGKSEGNEWDRRRAVWPNYSAREFLVALGEDGEPIAATLPWSPSEAKRLRVDRLAPPLALLFGALGRFGLRVPAVGEPFATLYLTHLVFAPGLPRGLRAPAIAAFLDRVFRRPDIDRYQMVSYADPDTLRREPALRNPLVQTTGVDLYVVSDSEIPPRIPPNEGVGFEMALV